MSLESEQPEKEREVANDTVKKRQPTKASVSKTTTNPGQTAKSDTRSPTTEKDKAEAGPSGMHQSRGPVHSVVRTE